MAVSVVETTVTGVGDTPVPGSKSTTTGARKFVPVIVMIWPPAGLPMDGVTPLMVGAVEGGGGVSCGAGGGRAGFGLAPRKGTEEDQRQGRQHPLAGSVVIHLAPRFPNTPSHGGRITNSRYK